MSSDDIAHGPPRFRRVAFLYDIHGNAPALEAVLHDVRAAAVEAVVIGGDVMPGPLVRDCLALIDAIDVPVLTLSGNGEHDVLRVARGEVPTRVPESVRPVLAHANDELDDTTRARITAWPDAVELEIAGVGRIFACHATPQSDDELVTAATPESALRTVFDVSADVVIVGHTHMPFDRTIGRTRVINAGSVGMPFGDTAAQWLLIGPDVEARRVAYDLDAALERMKARPAFSIVPLRLHKPPGAEYMISTFESARTRARR